MSRTAMNITSDNGREIAQRARADAAAADVHAVHASVEMLVNELRAERREVRALRLQLEAIRRSAEAGLANCRDERAALVLGDIAVRATSPDAPATLRVVHRV